VIPADAYLLLAEQNRRLCLPSGNSDQTRRVIRKLVLHFCGSSLPTSAQRIAEANLALVSGDEPETYSLRCLSAVTRIVREEARHQELLAKFDGLPDAHARLDEQIARLSGGDDAQ
jgi:hypothetical protein